MNYFLAILAGLVQGLTEFLPISSSGHLVIFHEIFNFQLQNNLLFDVVLHLGTLGALVLFFYSDIVKLAQAFFTSLVKWNLKQDHEQRLAWLIIIGTVPAAILGYFFEDLITTYFHQTWLVGVMLIIIAIAMWLTEKYAESRREISQLNLYDSLIIGLAQAVALIPGTSRSGMTIIAGMGQKLKRQQAARFSFLLSIPIVLAAGVKQVLEINWTSQADLWLLALGFVSALVSGYLSIKFLLNYLTHHSLNIFVWYRLTIGCLILIWFFFLRGL